MTDEMKPTTPQPKAAPKGTDPLAFQDKPAGDGVHQDIIDAVADAKEEGREEADKLFAERQAAGFAPPLDPTDPRPREVKEQEVKEAMGVSPQMSQASNQDLGPSSSFKPKSSAEVAKEMERLRSGPGAMQSEVRDVTIDGVRYRVPTDRAVSMPESVKRVLEEADRPVRTSQMLGGNDGTPTIDLTKD